MSAAREPRPPLWSVLSVARQFHCKMQQSPALAAVLLAAAVALLQPAALLAVCCSGATRMYIEEDGVKAYCSDGAPTDLRGVPFSFSRCGVGACNFFGCDCDGGCRPFHPPVTIKVWTTAELIKMCPGIVQKDIKDDSQNKTFYCKGDMMEQGRHYTVEELASKKEVCGCFGTTYPSDLKEPILLSEFELVERPEVVISDKLHCHPGHGACVLEIEHIKSFTVTTGFEISATLDFSKVVPASVSLTKKTDWAHETGTSLKYQCQAQEGHSTWISVKPQYYKAKTLQPTGWHTRRNGETGIPVCDVTDVYLPRINSHGSIAGDVHCHAEKLNL